MADTADVFDNLILRALRKSTTGNLTVGQLWGMPIRRGLTDHLQDMRDRELVTYDSPITMETVVSLPQEGT